MNPTDTEKVVSQHEIAAHAPRSSFSSDNTRLRADTSDDALQLCVRTTSDTGKVANRTLDLQELGVKRGGILELAIRACPHELEINSFSAFEIVLRSVCKSKWGREYLSSPPEQIGSTKIQSMLLLARRESRESLETRAKSLSAFAEMLSNCSKLLRDGKTIAEAAATFFSLMKLPIGQNYVEITTRGRVNGVQRESLKIIDFDALGVEIGGLLSEAHSGAPEFIHPSEFYATLSILSKLAEVKEGNRLLSTPAAQLEVSDISHMFSIVDGLLPAHSSRVQYFDCFQKFMSFSLAQLKSGQSFSDAAYGFRCSAAGSRNLQKGENHEARDEKSKNILDVLKVISAESDEDLYEKATSQLRAHMDTYLIACEQVLNEQGECVERMNGILAAGPPKTLPQKIYENYNDQGRGPAYDTMKRLPQDAIDWLLLTYVNKEEMHINAATSNRGFGLSSFLTSYGLQRTAGYAFDVALSQFYLTRRSIIACFIIIAIKTGWNGSTVASLSTSRIRKTGSGYHLTGLKTKTNQYQKVEIEEVEWRTKDRLACRAIELLDWHNKNIDKFLERRNPSVFCALRLRCDGPRIANLVQLSTSLKIFLEANNLQRMAIRDYRTLRLNYTYVKGGGDIIGTQIKAGHAKLSTTARYIRFKVQTDLHEANIRRYMRILAKSVLWITGRTELDDSGESKAARRLLFPASPHVAEKHDNAADQWLIADGEMTLEITEIDAVHCCYQQKFYKEKLDFLISFNEKRFLEFHLPRIAFCAALHRLLKKSPFAHVLRRAEFAEPA